jgi:nucleoside phosphorylase
MAKVLILTALPAELPEAALALLGSRAAEFQVAFTGVGKINAALATLQALQKWQPRLVINFGTAGKVNSDLHGLIDIGQACHTQSVPWAAYKYITDDANADSAHDWQSNVHKGATLFMQRLLAE